MGSAISRKGSTSGSASYSRAGSSQQLPRPPMRRSISSVLICGASSSSAEMEDYPAELLVNSAEHGPRKKLRNSDLSVGIRGDLISMKNNDAVSSTRLSGAYAITEDGSSHDDPSDRGKWLSESRELVPSRLCFDSSRYNGTASSSNGGQPSPYSVSENGMSSTGNMNGMDSIKEDTSRIGVGFNNSTGVSFNALGESFLDEISVENYVSEEFDYSSSNFSSSFVSGSPLDDVPQEVTPSDENLLNVDVISISNPLPANSAEINSREIRRNSRRLFWDAFSRRSSRRHAASRTFVFSPFNSDHVRSPDRQLLDFSGGLIDDEFRGDLRSHGIRTPGSNDRWLNPRFELWDNFGDALDSTYPPPACPRGVHADGTCLCQSSSLAEESGPRTGISRIIMLAEALFEVLDQIHQQPMSLSLSVVSLPAPESVVDSFPVKTHGKTENLEFADDVSQCYICLAEYEEGDRIRVLPCHHEYHMTCVDKWLKEIHGVCPLCRGDVSLGSRDV